MIRVGTSGFSYDDWHGPFYPPKLRPGDRLRCYAERFSCVEVNSSWYRQPTAATMAGMVGKVAQDFRFSVKVYGGITHDWGSATDRDFLIFREGLAPLCEAGMLGCVLAQFPNSFRPSRETVAHLARLRDRWPDLPLVVEFRHEAWLDDRAFERLRRLELGFCCVDEPELPGLMPPRTEVTAALAYVRFHGRNARMWYEHEQAWQRYDYLYGAEELDEWVPRIKGLAQRADEVYVFFNNHYEAQAVVNAQDLVARLSELASQSDEGPGREA